MTLVTLVGEKMAKEGMEFIYLGPHPECKNCKLKTVCFNLKKGRRYKILNVREKRHDCNVHEDGVRVVEVDELPLIAAVRKGTRKNAKIKIKSPNCAHLDCKYYELCHNPAVLEDKEYKVIKLLEPIECKEGKGLIKAELSDI